MSDDSPLRTPADTAAAMAALTVQAKELNNSVIALKTAVWSLEQRMVVTEERDDVGEERADIAEQRADVSEARADDVESRANISEVRADVAAEEHAALANGLNERTRVDDPKIGRPGSESPPPRHSATPDGSPISGPPPVDSYVKQSSTAPATHASVAAVGQDLADVNSRVADLDAQVQRVCKGMIAIGIFAALTLIFTLVVGFFTWADHNTLNQLGARQATSDTQRAHVEAVQRDFLCTLFRFDSGNFNSTARANDPRGTTSYDAPFVSLREGAATIGCAP